MDELIAPALGDVIVANGAASVELFTWMADITAAVNNLPPLTGSGSPEAVLVASVGRWYVDTTANVTYFKKTGDTNTGWVLTN